MSIEFCKASLLFIALINSLYYVTGMIENTANKIANETTKDSYIVQANKAIICGFIACAVWTILYYITLKS